MNDSDFMRRAVVEFGQTKSIMLKCLHVLSGFRNQREGAPMGRFQNNMRLREKSQMFKLSASAAVVNTSVT